MRNILLCSILLILAFPSFGQTSEGQIKLTITHDRQPVSGVNVGILKTNLGSATDKNGKAHIRNIPPGSYTLQISAVGYKKVTREIDIE